ncbi:MAG: RagB/SusD family nutrient uptake outer membrane protein [Ferruginibacter sp.]
MNKFKSGLLFLLFIPLIFSCRKVLDTSPYNSITDASAFSTAAKCALVMNGVYDAAQTDFYVTGTTEGRGYPFGAASIYQSDARGEDLVNIQAFLQVTYQATYNATNANSAAMWKGLYELINKANIGIDGFRKASGGVIPVATAAHYEGECRLLRAMAHHEALLHWSKPYLDGAGSSLGVPWRDFPINSSAAVTTILNTPRPTVAFVYTNILTDLDYAEANLGALISTNTSIPGSNIAGVNTFRATKAAAIALKMRVKMHMGDWAGVVAEGNKLVPVFIPPAVPVSPIGGWTLTASPDGPFANNSSVESIFSIKNDPIDAPSTNGALSRLLGSGSLGGRGLVSLSPVIYNNAGWLCDDKRRTLLTVAGTNSATTQSIFTTKYRDYPTYSDWAPMVRYAEVLLTLAEAEARLNAGVSIRAVDLLNVVRNRSLNTPLTQAYTVASFANQVALVRAILLERRIELLAEGRRWGDISRLVNDANYTTGGIPAKALNGTAGLATFVCGAGYVPGQAAIAYSNFLFLWPIPLTEIQTNPIIVQNPGY